MKTKFLFSSAVFLLICFSSSAQVILGWNSPQRFVQMVFNQNQIKKGAAETYTNRSTDLVGNTFSLTCNITQPLQVYDPMANRPVIVLVPGGGFGSIEDAYYQYYEEQYARMGYVVLKINRYRLYRDTYYGNYSSIKNEIEATAKDKNGKYSAFPGLAVYVAMQDVNAAIKYLVNKKDVYRIDPTKIFLFGESAGAVTVQALALTKPYFMTNEMVDLYNLQGYGGLDQTLHSDLVVKAQNNGLDYTIRGVFPIAGTLINDALLQADDRMPMWMEQNTNDGVALQRIQIYETEHKDPNSRSSIPYNVVINKIKNMNIQGANYPCSYYLFTTTTSFDYCVSNVCHCMDPTKSGWQNVIRPMIGTFCKRILNGNTSCDPSYYNGTYYFNLFSTSSVNARIGNDLDNEVYEEVALSVYPNPTNSLVTIKGLNRDNTITIKAYDVLGHEVLSKEVAAGTSNEDYILSLQGLSAGCYYLHIPNQSTAAVIKIIKVD
ncbi:T9SS type A sorting domain-containing protein [Cytophaga aurantiaca]|uniref:T9SS type A sorting domain-containing protein n=1 Tax=Cytophaga aurantiaca TaxID=29530 RepID=UPI0003618203|nr:T9SS type A sorting domain-containing protein [Cytophaga aurantiaca]